MQLIEFGRVGADEFFIYHTCIAPLHLFRLRADIVCT
jgi:hypothetical protein